MEYLKNHKLKLFTSNVHNLNENVTFQRWPFWLQQLYNTILLIIIKIIIKCIVFNLYTIL